MVDGVAAAGQTINFAMISLFPPTYRSRANGMRLDLANVSLDKRIKLNSRIEPNLSGFGRDGAYILAISWWKESREE